MSEFEVTRCTLRALGSVGISNFSYDSILQSLKPNQSLILRTKSDEQKLGITTIVAINPINFSISKVQSVILVPSKEIAANVHAFIKSLLKDVVGLLPPILCTGGVKATEDAISIHSGAHIIIGTPGRMAFLLSAKLISVEFVRTFILMDANWLFGSNMNDAVTKVWCLLPNNKKIVIISPYYTTLLKSQLICAIPEALYIGDDYHCPLDETLELTSMAATVYNHCKDIKDVSSLYITKEDSLTLRQKQWNRFTSYDKNNTTSTMVVSTDESCKGMTMSTLTSSTSTTAMTTANLNVMVVNFELCPTGELLCERINNRLLIHKTPHNKTHQLQHQHQPVMLSLVSPEEDLLLQEHCVAMFGQNIDIDNSNSINSHNSSDNSIKEYVEMDPKAMESVISSLLFTVVT
eukprot:gene11209-23421_t